MMIRLDFDGSARRDARAIRIGRRPAPGIVILADPGPRLPFRDGAADEIFAGRTIAARADVSGTLDELWRVSKPGALIHMILPHASSTVALTREPSPRPMITLNTFNYYDPRHKPSDAPSAAVFTIERAALRVAGPRAGDSGLALARGPFARFVERLANGSRGSQYRFERWFAGLIGGFEEFSVVLAAVKTEPRARAVGSSIATKNSALAFDSAEIQVTSDVGHEAANIEPEAAEPHDIATTHADRSSPR